MDPMSLITLVLGGVIGWYALLRAPGKSKGVGPWQQVAWIRVGLFTGVMVGLELTVGYPRIQSAVQDMLVGAAIGVYVRLARRVGRYDLWRSTRPRESSQASVESDASVASASSDDVYARGSRNPARRAVLRWAWRLVRREWRQQFLVVALIITAVAGTVLGAAIATNASPPADEGFGSAQHLVMLPGTDSHLSADLTALRSRFGTIDVIENQNIATGMSQGTQLRAQDPHGGYGGPMLALLSGSYPSGAGEVAMTKSLASTLNVQVGGTWQDGGRSLRVVGLVEDPLNLADNFALLAPGQLVTPDSVTVLFDATSAAVAAAPLPDGTAAISPGTSNGISPALIVFAVAVLALTFTSLVSTAGFAALARRRQRALGMLSAMGATDRDVQLVMLANGAIVGAVGALVGTALGLAGWIAYAPSYSADAGHRVSWTQLPWWLVFAAIPLAVISATLASRQPARAVARMPIVAALSGRPAPAAPAYRTAAPAILLTAAGPVLLALSGGWGAQGGKALPMQLGGLLVSALGLALLAPFAVARLSGPAKHAPVAARLALRDLARYRSRSAAALAASSLAILIAMLVILITTGRYDDPVDYFGPNLPSNQLILYAPGAGPGTGRGPGQVPTAQDAAALEQHIDSVAAALQSSDVLALQPVEADLLRKTPQKTTGNSGSIYLATPAVLKQYGVAASSIDPTALLITSRPGLAGASGLNLLYGDLESQSPDAQTNAQPNPEIQTLAALPLDTSEPNLMVTEYAVHKLGLHVDPTSGWLIQTSKPLTAVQINTARQLALAAGMTVEVRSAAPSLTQVRDDATGAGILLALGVLAMTVGLIRTEAAGDLRILTATGASRRVARNLTAVTAGAIGLLAAVSGTAIAYLDTAAFFDGDLAMRLSQVPAEDLLAVLLALPAVAAIGGWLLAGRDRSARASA